MRKVVVNTTPLIALSHVGKLDLLEQLYGEIIIPEAVYKELSVKDDSICKKTVDRSLQWIQVCSIGNQMAKTMYKTQLHDSQRLLENRDTKTRCKNCIILTLRP